MKFNQIIRNTSIQKKILSIYGILIVLSITILTSSLYYFTRKNILDQVCRAKVNTLKQINEKLNALDEKIIIISNVFFLDQEVRSFLKQEETDDEYIRSKEQYTIKNIVAENKVSLNNIYQNTTILGFNEKYYSDRFDYTYEEDYVRTEKWKQDILKHKNDILKKGTYAYKNSFIFSYVRYLIDIYSGQPLGLLIMDFDESILEDIYRDTMDKNSNILIVDPEGKIISSNNKEELLEFFSYEEFNNQIKDRETGYFQYKYQNQSSMISFCHNKATGWYIIDITPISFMLKDINNAKLTIMFWSVLLLIIAALISARLSFAITNPIKKLDQSMKKVQQGDFSSKADIIQKDEIGDLADSFNVMVDKIQNLIDEVHLQNELKLKAEIKALQAQINPHFLYNTLTTIRWMSKSGQADMVNRMIISLVKILKLTFTNEQYITIEQELEVLKEYIFILQIRYNNKFQVTFDVEESIYPCKILKLLLQPIVENAIFHGIEPKEGNGNIVIKGYRHDSSIQLIVQDDGVGIVEKNLDNLLNNIKSHRFNNIGLENILQRIKLNYGEEYGMEVVSKEGEGTIVTINIPII